MQPSTGVRGAALLGVLVLLCATNVQAQDFGSFFSSFFGGSGGNHGRGGRPRPNAAYTNSVVNNKLGPFLIKHPKCRPALLRTVVQGGGVQAVNEALVVVIKGIATGQGSASAIAKSPGYGRLPGNAKALSRTLAQALYGSAIASDMSEAEGFNAIAASQAIAKACRGIALSASQAQTKALLSGRSLSDSQAYAIWGAAVSSSSSSCISAFGGCQAIGRAVSVAVGGTAAAQSDCFAQGPRGATAACSSHAFSVGGPAIASSSATAVSGRKMLSQA